MIGSERLSTDRNPMYTSTERSTSIETKSVIPVVRVIAVAPIPIDELENNLRRGHTPFFTEVLLSKNTHENRPSADKLAAFGHHMDPELPVFDNALRAFGREATGYTMSVDTFRDRWTAQELAIPSFLYRLPGWEDRKPREAHLMVVPFWSRSFCMHEVRQGKDEREKKLKQVIPLSPDQFAYLVEHGSLATERIVGHLTKADSEVRISPSERVKQYTALDAAVREVKGFEVFVKERVLFHVNRIRRVHNGTIASSLDTCSRTEIITGYRSAQMELALADERKREMTGGITPPAKKDALKILQFFIGVKQSELPDLLYAIPTREAMHGINTLKRAMREGVAELLLAVGKHRPTKDELADPFRALLRIWPAYLNLPEHRRVRALARADEHFIATLARTMGKPVEQVRTSYEMASTFDDFINQSLQPLRKPTGVSGESAQDDFYFQDHRRMNEVANAKPFSQLIMALQLHPNIPIPHDETGALTAVDILSHEAQQMSFPLVLSAVEAISRIRGTDNSLFEAAVDSLFVFPPEKDIMDLGDGIVLPVYHRMMAIPVSDRRLHMIVDERKQKGIHSAMSKQFLNPNLNDIYSTNFVLAEDNFSQGSDSTEERLALAGAFSQELLAHLRSRYEKHGYHVDIVEGTHKTDAYDRVHAVAAMTEQERRVYVSSLSGVRPGSKGDYIIREKFILSIARGSERYINEVCIYPFEHVASAPDAILRESGFWGFQEKIRDDALGFYKAKRIYERDTRRPTDPSPYELLYSGILYAWLQLRIIPRQLKK